MSDLPSSVFIIWLADGGETDAFSEPQANAPATCEANLPQFVTVRGGGYFFMPGIKALRFIATHDDGDER